MHTYTGTRKDIANAIGRDFGGFEVSEYAYFVAICKKIRDKRKFAAFDLSLSCKALGSGSQGVVYSVEVETL